MKEPLHLPRLLRKYIWSKCVGTEGRNRTDTPVKEPDLNPARLPVPPPRHVRGRSIYPFFLLNQTYCGA